MSIRKKLGLGVASAALGLSLVAGGEFAYFNDVETNASTFAAGTLDINIKGNDANNAIVDVANLKPGDIMTRTFKLNNIGSLDVSKVFLTSDYTVNDANGNNDGADFGEHINVTILVNNDKRSTVVLDTTLKDLSRKDVVQRDLLGAILGEERSGLPAGTSDEFSEVFHFVDNNQDQNVFQGNSLQLNWTFDAKQTAGSIR